MSDNFANQLIPCPHCQETAEFKGCRGPVLECSERNYSGCAVDMAHCPECGRGYQISYSVAEVSPQPSWDMASRAEREDHDRKCKREEAQRKRDELAKLEAAEQREG